MLEKGGLLFEGLGRLGALSLWEPAGDPSLAVSPPHNLNLTTTHKQDK